MKKVLLNATGSPTAIRCRRDQTWVCLNCGGEFKGAAAAVLRFVRRHNNCKVGRRDNPR